MDENELISYFCNSRKCSSCNGTDCTGEPNGYGCDLLDDFLDYIYTLQEDIVNQFTLEVQGKNRNVFAKNVIDIL